MCIVFTYSTCRVNIPYRDTLHTSSNIDTAFMVGLHVVRILKSSQVFLPVSNAIAAVHRVSFDKTVRPC